MITVITIIVTGCPVCNRQLRHNDIDGGEDRINSHVGTLPLLQI